MEPSNNLVLGSQSPRRKHILEQAGFSFKVVRLDVKETHPDGLEAAYVAQYLAEVKNAAYLEKFQHSTIITADTLVVLDETILGKPQNSAEAFEMLTSLSGSNHLVITGVCIQNKEKKASFSSKTEVSFSPLSHKEINHYIEKFKPFDKAGAYGIQEWIGLIAVQGIKGSYFNVMGLPIDEVYTILSHDFNIKPF